jgi:solute carrier family 35 protein F5
MKLTLGETIRLSIEFSMPWILANYLASACLEYTSVASATILTSTSSIWTLIFCAFVQVERFSLRKLAGVIASLAGVILVSTVDLTSGNNDDDNGRGSFPEKTLLETAVGDIMAIASAVVYGIYVTMMKRRVGNEACVNLPLFLGLVGCVNMMVLWPGFFVLDWANIERVRRRWNQTDDQWLTDC